MTALPLRQFLTNVSDLAYGCMGLGGDWDPDSSVTLEHVQQAHEVIDAALEAGINFFDHADIYTRGKAETVFGRVLKQRPELRQQIYLQSKCGIRFDDELGPKRYDFSGAWITRSVDGILTRLNADYIDVLLLHRPDPLMDIDEVAKTFLSLRESGKVNHFGVSNMHCHQVAYLQSHLDMPLVVNQLEISLQQRGWVDEGVYAGNPQGADVNFTAGTLEHCRQQGVQVQSWGSLCQGLFSGRDVSEQPGHIRATADLVASLAEKYQVSQEAILLAWIMRHPSRVQPVIGTTNIARIKACSEVGHISLSREDWYALYVSARGQKLP
ncbi:aldo/keto reductase [Pseudomaricurvus alkylphenolicus]|jgi:predicted oxidoreductase|uniref:aldo/keto reductase n=1 Tax=Pseudomaricurvus alkylphenolicus TaxID=1306991 RepID=UPI0014248B0C|nr:aldo/keto reductase [Pseudomaricurvus alkylphenolicus]NIB40551.1 aldo/keto reductase [Pseudomaricurvus alkylphenolicus]